MELSFHRKPIKSYSFNNWVFVNISKRIIKFIHETFSCPSNGFPSLILQLGLFLFVFSGLKHLKVKSY